MAIPKNRDAHRTMPEIIRDLKDVIAELEEGDHTNDDADDGIDAAHLQAIEILLAIRDKLEELPELDNATYTDLVDSATAIVTQILVDLGWRD